MTTATPLPPKQFTTVKGHRLAHVEMGRADPIVLLHGNPTSSYLWRDVMPPLASLGRVIAPDLIGHGDSDKLPASDGPGRYTLEGNYELLAAQLAPWARTSASRWCCTTGAAPWAFTGPGCTRSACVASPTWKAS